MTSSFELLAGLPPYGDPAIPFPPEWGRLGREGTVVRLRTNSGQTWSANLQRGIEGITDAFAHPDGRRVVVLSRGDLWLLDPDARSAESVGVAIEAVWVVSAPSGFVFSRQGLAFLRLAAEGILWHTRRLSWDGFDDVELTSRHIRGKAWNAIDDLWNDFEVDLATGRSTGGGFDLDDTEGWECPAPRTMPSNERCS
jgi:hypothetical protein